MAFLDKIHPLLKRTRENKYSDSNYAILNAIDKQLEEMELETIQSKSQSAIYTATGWFLDNAWGKWFGVKRKTGESDSDYRDRIIEKVNIPRGTVESVKYGIREFLENEYIGIEIYEPWEDIFYLNRVSSRLNGKHHLIGEYYNYGVMDITVGETFPKDMLDVIDLFKPAGVTVHVNVDLDLPSNDPNAEKELLPTHKLNVYDNYKEYERTIGMFEGIMGKFSIFDKVNIVDGEDFILHNTNVNIDDEEPDPSLFNNRTDLIRGNTETLNDFEHVVGVGTNFNPSPNFRLQDLDEHTTIKEPTDLSLPNNNLGYIYTVFDLIHFYTNHKDKIIKNDRYSYIDYLSNNNFTLSLNGESGRTFEVEYYNFLNKEWELLERNLFKENTTIVSKQIDMHKALNDNLIIIIRVKTFNKPVTIEDMYLEYRYDKELPISVRGSNTGHSFTLSFEENNEENELDSPKTPLVDKAKVDEDTITE